MEVRALAASAALSCAPQRCACAAPGAAAPCCKPLQADISAPTAPTLQPAAARAAAMGPRFDTCGALPTPLLQCNIENTRNDNDCAFLTDHGPLLQQFPAYASLISEPAVAAVAFCTRAGRLGWLELGGP